MTFVIRTSVSREVDKCQYGQVPVVQWIRNRMDVAPWCFKWGRIGMEWNEMGWKSLGYANSTYNAKISTYAQGCRKNHNICALVSQITIYGHLCPKKIQDICWRLVSKNRNILALFFLLQKSKYTCTLVGKKMI